MELTEEQRAVERVRLELVTRRLSIMLLGVMSVLVGIAMMLTGAPSFIEFWFSPWSRFAIGIAAFGPGLLVVIGEAMHESRRCGWWASLAGLSLLTLWDAFMALAYTKLVLDEGLQLARVGEALDLSVSGRAYVPLIYLSLLMLAAVPLVTLIRVGRPPR